MVGGGGGVWGALRYRLFWTCSILKTALSDVITCTDKLAAWWQLLMYHVLVEPLFFPYCLSGQVWQNSQLPLFCVRATFACNLWSAFLTLIVLPHSISLSRPFELNSRQSLKSHWLFDCGRSPVIGNRGTLHSEMLPMVYYSSQWSPDIVHSFWSSLYWEQEENCSTAFNYVSGSPPSSGGARNVSLGQPEGEITTRTVEALSR